MDFVWTNEAVGRLAALAQSGYSSSAIAAALADEYGRPVSRSAVIGKLHRSGIALGAKRCPSPKPQPAARPKIRFRQPRPVKTPPLAPPATAVEPALKATPVTFAELEPHHCRWPLGDVGNPDFRFCGSRRALGRPYCEERHAKAWRRL